MSAPLIFTAEYYERMRQLESGGWWNAAMRDIAATLLARAALPERGMLLDVGCGSGQTMTWALGLLPRWSASGIDVSLDGLSAARDAGAGVAQASALALPYPTASVDLIITLDVVQHLPLQDGDVTALREMRRVLRPGGYLLLRTNAQAFPRTADDPRYDFHKYRPAELREKLREAGFDVLRLSRVNALLGLAEIPRELRARRMRGRDGYGGILATANGSHGWTQRARRAWLRAEGRAVAAGLTLPLGRTICALCRT
jgi:SAM-dependent methyltransferase